MRGRVVRSIIDTEDPNGRRVRLDRSTWHGHIARRHPEVVRYLRDVERAVSAPDYAEWDDREIDVINYYRLNLRPADPMGQHLRVVVRFGSFANLQFPLFGKVGGAVVSAYFVSELKGSGKLEF